MSNVSLVAPSLDRWELDRGVLLWQEAGIRLNPRSYDVEMDTDTNFLLCDTQAEELAEELLAMTKRVKEINKTLPLNKVDATLQEFQKYFTLEHKLSLELSGKTKEEIANWEGVLIASFGDYFACVLQKRKGQDYKFSTK